MNIEPAGRVEVDASNQMKMTGLGNSVCLLTRGPRQLGSNLIGDAV